MQNMEDIGGVSMDAEIDLSGLEKATKSYADLLTQVNRNMGLTEKGLTAVEASGKAAAGSIDDLSQRAKALQQELNKLDPETQAFVNKAKSLNVVLKEMKAAQDLAANSTVGLNRSFSATTLGSKALGVALGMLGVQSVDMVVRKFADLSKEAVQLAIKLEGVQERAKAIFGADFPQMQQATAALATQLRRSSSDLLAYATGFGTVLDSVGATAAEVDKYSTQLSQLTVNLGKAFPDKSDAEIFDILQSGIEGNVRGLRQLGIVMTDTSLKRYAETHNIRLKISAMTDEQKTMLRSMYLIDETKKLQEAGAASTGKLGDSAKMASAKWKDFLENIGLSVGPVLNAATIAFVGMAENWMRWIGTLRTGWDVLMREMSGGVYKERRQDGFAVIDYTKQGFTQRNEELMRGNLAATSAAAKTGELGPDFWKQQPGMGGGGGENKPLEEAKKIISEIDKTEKDIAEELKKQADANKDRLDAVRDELEFKKQAGTITKDELRQLERINDRVAYQKDKVKEATDAWEKQRDAVKSVKEEVDKIQEGIVESHKKLKETLDDIDAQTKDKKQDKILDMMKERDELNLRVARGEGLSPEQQDRLAAIDKELKRVQGGAEGDQPQIDMLMDRRRQLQAYIDANKDDPHVSESSAKQMKEEIRQLDEMIRGMNPASAADTAAYAGAKAIYDSKETDLQKIDREGEEKKKDAARKANKDLQDQLDKLGSAQLRLNQAQDMETQLAAKVVQAHQDMKVSAETNFAAIDSATEKHVKHELEYLAQLKAALDATAKSYAVVADYMNNPTGAAGAQKPGKFASGGPIVGPGTGTSDSIPAWLSNGEHVLTAAEVAAAGGHGEIFRLRAALRSGIRLNLPRFAQGGPVTSNTDNSRSVRLTQHFHGVAAGVMASPSMIHWHARRALR